MLCLALLYFGLFCWILFCCLWQDPVSQSRSDYEVCCASTLSTNQILQVTHVNKCLEENGREHHTDKYQKMKNVNRPQLVVRRGQSFKLIIYTNRQYSQETDGICFIFTVSDEKNLNPSGGNLVAVPLLNKVTENEHLLWSALLQTYNSRTMTVLITAAVDCIVAQWKMEIDCRLKQGAANTYSHNEGIFILFNPWCQNDQVYMKSEEWREECVLNETGLIWLGTSTKHNATPWKFAQFEQDILECSIFATHIVGKLNGRARGNPIRTTRVLSAVVNSEDDYGILEGNWTRSCNDGTKPTDWFGSKEIMQNFYRKKRPVKYGQCWVYAGVLCTICRALGIPSRPVTIYSSAVDSNENLELDIYVNSHALISETIWNFHVWNEVWMKRPDIGSQYDGWQVVDGTPFRLSNDIYQLGPSPVVAAKNGELLKPYDTKTLFSEVNADMLIWRYEGSGHSYKLLERNTDFIGQYISTKLAGKWARLDITTSYKYPEHTKEERGTIKKALSLSGELMSRYALNADFNDIKFKFEQRDDVIIGQPFEVKLVMQNNNKRIDYNVDTVLRVDCVLYNKSVQNSLKCERIRKTIKAGGTEVLKLYVSYEEYVKRLLDQCAFQIACLATVEDTEFEYFAQNDFRVLKPNIKIKLDGNPVQNKEILAEVSVENPLPVALRNGKFMIQGPGLVKQLELKVVCTEPGMKAYGSFKFTPVEVGRQTIVARFTSKLLDHVDGFLNFMVCPTNIRRV